MTKGQLLLFKNDQNIEDEDQVEIMKEVLHYLEAPSLELQDIIVWSLAGKLLLKKLEIEFL